MLAEKNKDIRKAYDLLQVISKDDKARMIYDAREAELRDQSTRIKSAEEKGKTEGIDIGIDIGEDRKGMRIAENLLRMGMKVEEIATVAEISVEKVLEIERKQQH